MQFLRTLPLFRNGNVAGDLSLECNFLDRSVSIKYKDDFGGQGAVEGDDFFWALSELRDRYSRSGYVVLCVGALCDVFPGGLVSEESCGELVYRIDGESGEKRVVNIFDAVGVESIEDLCDSGEQKANRISAIRKFSVNQ